MAAVLLALTCALLCIVSIVSPLHCVLILRGCVINLLSSHYLRLSEKASTPHLDRQYPPPVRDSRPRILATFTTLPWAFFSSGRNWRVTSMTPIRFTSKTFLKSSSCIHSVGPMGTDLPALFTRPHRPAETRGRRITSRYQLLIFVSLLLMQKNVFNLLSSQILVICCRQNSKLKARKGLDLLDSL